MFRKRMEAWLGMFVVAVVDDIADDDHIVVIVKAIELRPEYTAMTLTTGCEECFGLGACKDSTAALESLVAIELSLKRVMAGQYRGIWRGFLADKTFESISWKSPHKMNAD